MLLNINFFLFFFYPSKPINVFGYIKTLISVSVQKKIILVFIG